MAAKKAATRKKELVGPGTSRPSSDAAAQPATASIAGTNVDLRKIKVRALETGFYQHKRRREGDVFHLVPLRTVKRATPEDCKKDRRLTVGMVLKDPDTRKPIPVVMTAMDQFSDKWMELADDDDRVRITGVKESMKKEHDRILREKNDIGGDPDGDDDQDEGAGFDADSAANSGEDVDDNVLRDSDKEVL